MPSIKIRTASLQYGTGRVDCVCVTEVTTPLGVSEVAEVVTLMESEDLDNPAWTDADLCGAVAARLGVAASEVTIQPAPPNVEVTVPPQDAIPPVTGELTDPEPAGP